MNGAKLTLENIESYLTLFGDNVYIQALVVILIAAIIAKLTDWFITRGLTRLTKRTRSNLDDQLIRILHRPIFLTVLMLGLLIAVHLVAPTETAQSVAVNLIQTLVTLIWVVFGTRALTIIIVAMVRDENRFKFVQEATRPLLETASKLLIIALGVYFILISWGVDPVGWLATAGIAAVAVGLAAQDTLGNLFAGISILADSPYRIGDYIVLDGQERGTVTRIGLRSTRILTRDDLEITIPNSVIASSKIINETAGRWVKQRLRIPVGVAYGSDSDLVKRVLLESVKAETRICDDPEPWVKFCTFGESSLNFEIRCWIDDPALRGRIVDSVNSLVYKALAEHKIEIPFPKRDLYIKQMPKEFISKVDES
ncbi:MAG: mechanosensitive ion channel [Acidobacteriota bacterium]|nr:MAG: mechanosensitive ion channel [Acidobacteriota bacterium]